MHPIIDAHIHFYKYKQVDRQRIMTELSENRIQGLIAVSDNLQSAVKTLSLANKYRQIFPAIGYHPEQILPSKKELEKIFQLIDQNHKALFAIGEIGLPYYLRQQKGIDRKLYEHLLELFIKRAKKYDLPVNLHAIYDDAPIVCDILEKYSITKAHFHWFKGDQQTIDRLIDNHYFISVTPDVLYEKEIQQMVKKYPLHLLMVETDGPWPFKGPFSGKLTHPNMIHESIKKIATIKQLSWREVYEAIYHNTVEFYRLSFDERKIIEL